MKERRLQFFTGKGGVGKSTVVAALALRVSKQGKRTLVVEIHADSVMRRLFNAAFVGFEPLEVASNLFAVNISAEEALAEYIEEHVRMRRIAQRITQNSLLQAFFRTAPGVAELVTLNKIRSFFLEKDREGIGPAYDCILVDLPATGHALAFLSLPRQLMQIAGVGPLRKVLAVYRDLLADAATTEVNLVTLPEEMPVTETLELAAALREGNDAALGTLYVNGVPPSVFDKDERDVLLRLERVAEHLDQMKAPLLTAREAVRREDRVRGLLAKLIREAGMKTVTIPRLLVDGLDRSAVERLSGLMRAVEEGV